MSTATPNSIAATPTNAKKVPIREGFLKVASTRLSAVRQKRAVLVETATVTLLMILIFQPAIAMWWRRWTLPESPQGYAVIVAPLTLAWIWLNRFRLALPELGVLLKRTADNKLKRRSSRTGSRGDGPDASQRMDSYLAEITPLLRDKPPVYNRLSWPLGFGCVISALGIWMNEPTLSGIGFVVTVVGLIAYRQGTQMLRCFAFPIFLLATAIPIPGPIIDPIMPFVQQSILGGVLHILLNSNLPAELSPDGNPLRIMTTTPVDVWAAVTGLGVAQMAAFVIVTIWYLSLVQGKIITKLWLVVFALALAFLLLIVRFSIITWVGASDAEMIKYVGPITLYLAPVIAGAIEFALIRGFKCRKYHRWVSI